MKNILTRKLNECWDDFKYWMRVAPSLKILAIILSFIVTALILCACMDTPSGPCHWYMSDYRVEIWTHDDYRVESVIEDSTDDGKVTITVTLTE